MDKLEKANHEMETYLAWCEDRQVEPGSHNPITRWSMGFPTVKSTN